MWSLVGEAPGNSHILPLAGGQGPPRVRQEERRACENSTHVLLCNHAVVSEAGSRTPAPCLELAWDSASPVSSMGPLKKVNLNQELLSERNSQTLTYPQGPPRSLQTTPWSRAGRAGDLVTKRKKDVNEVLAPRAHSHTHTEVALRWHRKGLELGFIFGPSQLPSCCSGQPARNEAVRRLVLPWPRVVAQAAAPFLGQAPGPLAGMKAGPWGSPWP